MNCGVGCRGGSDPVLLWLWCRPAAVALIQPLAWKNPYAAGVAPKRKKKKKKKGGPDVEEKQVTRQSFSLQERQYTNHDKHEEYYTRRITRYYGS